MTRPAQRGFTMVELIVTMVIIGILAVVVLPRFDLLRGFDEIGYRDQVKATLEYARKAAVAQRRSVQVTIASTTPPCSAAGDRCLAVAVQRQTPEGEGTASWVALTLPGSSASSIRVPSAVTSFTGVSPLDFDALGRPTGSANCPTGTPVNFCFTITGDSTQIITVERETGYVR
ncbi:MAG: prepilin-type N-terminal cleavage/methylation domain-containing protein [Rhodocyclaceae bacterium]|nr:prepilin-type N-terminal cleavage/methylation domain-containing protein [Rhodocyclaceae bacterium]